MCAVKDNALLAAEAKTLAAVTKVAKQRAPLEKELSANREHAMELARLR
jgi:hypothetical protein